MTVKAYVPAVRVLGRVVPEVALREHVMVTAVVPAPHTRPEAQAEPAVREGKETVTGAVELAEASVYWLLAATGEVVLEVTVTFVALPMLPVVPDVQVRSNEPPSATGEMTWRTIWALKSATLEPLVTTMAGPLTRAVVASVVVLPVPRSVDLAA